MAIPLPILLAAAAKVAKDERTHRVAKYLFESGKDALKSRGKTKAEPVATLPPPVVEKPTKGWRAGLNRKVRFRSGATGDLIRFRFTDEHGLTTQRMVGNWRSDGKSLSGFCLNMKRECEFPLSGIAEWEEVPVET
ncbi:hypothetical protein [Qipengyuania sp. SM2507]